MTVEELIEELRENDMKAPVVASLEGVEGSYIEYPIVSVDWRDGYVLIKYNEDEE